MNRIEELEAEVARLRERVAALEEELGVPVVTAVAVSGQGIMELAEAIPRARVPPPAIRGEVRRPRRSPRVGGRYRRRSDSSRYSKPDGVRG